MTKAATSLLVAICVLLDPAVLFAANQLPSITINSPSPGSNIPAVANVKIMMTALDADGTNGTVDLVEILEGTTIVGTAAQGGGNSVPETTFGFTWPNVPLGAHTITARATDLNGAVALSAPLTFTVTSAQTSSSVTLNITNSVSPAPTSVDLLARIPNSLSGVSRVEFLSGTTVIGSKTSAPFAFSWQSVGAGNYVLSARVTHATGVTTSIPFTLTVQNGNFSYAAYDFSVTDPDLLTQKDIRVFLPTDLPYIRGILLRAGASSEVTLDKFNEPPFDDFVHMIGFGYLGTRNFAGARFYQNSEAVFNALRFAAEQSGHPELNNLPFVGYGGSAGAGFAGGFYWSYPSRLIATSPVSGFYPPTQSLTLNGISNPPHPALKIPMTHILGETETSYDWVRNLFSLSRPLHSLSSLLEVLKGTHITYTPAPTLGVTMLEHAVRARYPADGSVLRDPRRGFVSLIDLPETSGWLADMSTISSGFTYVDSFAKFPVAKVPSASWFMDKDIAYIYRAYATFDGITTPPSNALNLVTPPTGPPYPWVKNPNSLFTPQVKIDPALFPNCVSVELYDGATSIELKQVSPGSTTIDFSPITTVSGLHVYHVLGISSSGIKRSSGPGLVAVRLPGIPPLYDALPDAPTNLRVKP